MGSYLYVEYKCLDQNACIILSRTTSPDATTYALHQQQLKSTQQPKDNPTAVTKPERVPKVR